MTGEGETRYLIALHYLQKRLLLREPQRQREGNSTVKTVARIRSIILKANTRHLRPGSKHGMSWLRQQPTIETFNHIV